MQTGISSRTGAGSCTTNGRPNVDKSRTSSGTRRSSSPHARTPRTPHLIALKDGDPIPEGYTYVVRERADVGSPVRTHMRSSTDTVDLSTPSKATEQTPADIGGSVNKKTTSKRNLTRNTNRKALTSFAREMKESLAQGRPTTIKVSEESSDLKAKWHAAAKECAYKYLDLTKESWKDYTLFEKGVVHKEVNEILKWDPPLDPRRIDIYLSGHLRTSRAVWKAHWQKHGDAHRHHNCPEVAWATLTKWWPTSACKEVAAEMASRRSRVQNISKNGRNSLLDRMDHAVSDNHIKSIPAYICGICPVFSEFVWVMQHVVVPHMYSLVEECNYYTQMSSQTADNEKVVTVDDDDGTSSYATGYSDEGEMEPDNIALTETKGEGLTALMDAIAAINATQITVIEKLTMLERAIGTVQFDMTYVRDDMKGVQNVVENIAEHVSYLKDAAAKVDGLQNQVAVDANPRLTWKGDTAGEDSLKSPSGSPWRGLPVYADDEEGRQNGDDNEVVHCIEETQAFEDNVNVHLHIASPRAGESGRQWGSERDASPALSPPTWQPKKLGNVPDLPEEESQQIELTCPGTQLRTPVSGASMWNDFTAAVRDWPAPCIAEKGKEDGWVSTKKARWDSLERTPVQVSAMRGPQEKEHVSLNLNLSPEKLVPSLTPPGRGDNSQSKRPGSATMKGGNGTGRGTARARRPPAVQPRYHSSVRADIVQACQARIGCLFIVVEEVGRVHGCVAVH